MRDSCSSRGTLCGLWSLSKAPQNSHVISSIEKEGGKTGGSLSNSLRCNPRANEMASWLRLRHGRVTLGTHTHTNVRGCLLSRSINSCWNLYQTPNCLYHLLLRFFSVASPETQLPRTRSLEQTPGCWRWRWAQLPLAPTPLLPAPTTCEPLGLVLTGTVLSNPYNSMFRRRIFLLLLLHKYGSWRQSKKWYIMFWRRHLVTTSLQAVDLFLSRTAKHRILQKRQESPAHSVMAWM